VGFLKWTIKYGRIALRDRTPNYLIIGWDYRCILDNVTILEVSVFMRRTWGFAACMNISFCNLVEDGWGM
jgi:hypothetical protein